MFFLKKKLIWNKNFFEKKNFFWKEIVLEKYFFGKKNFFHLWHMKVAVPN